MRTVQRLPELVFDTLTATVEMLASALDPTAAAGSYTAMNPMRMASVLGELLRPLK